MKHFVVRFLSRPGCHLCEEALPLVRREARRVGHEVQVVNIEDDDALLAEYMVRIPVVLAPDSTVLAEGRIERRPLRRALRKMGARGWLRRPYRR